MRVSSSIKPRSHYVPLYIFTCPVCNTQAEKKTFPGGVKGMSCPNCFTTDRAVNFIKVRNPARNKK